jgi:hypothetical protein
MDACVASALISLNREASVSFASSSESNENWMEPLQAYCEGVETPIALARTMDIGTDAGSRAKTPSS